MPRYATYRGYRIIRPPSPKHSLGTGRTEGIPASVHEWLAAYRGAYTRMLESLVRYRHWRNWATDGQVAFVTTTALDFIHVFRRAEMRERMSTLILRDCVRYEAPLYAFVVMPHHVHILVQCPPAKSVSWLVQRIKSNSAKLLLPLLNDEESAEFDKQRGLNRKSFWQDSFRSVIAATDEMLSQKLDYVHWNPVKAGLCLSPVDYRWSSARLYQDSDRLSCESGLRLADCLAEFDMDAELDDR